MWWRFCGGILVSRHVVWGYIEIAYVVMVTCLPWNMLYKGRLLNRDDVDSWHGDGWHHCFSLWFPASVKHKPPTASSAWGPCTRAKMPQRGLGTYAAAKEKNAVRIRDCANSPQAATRDSILFFVGGWWVAAIISTAVGPMVVLFSRPTAACARRASDKSLAAHRLLQCAEKDANLSTIEVYAFSAKLLCFSRLSSAVS